MRLRIYNSYVTDPRRNLAVEEALVNRVLPDEAILYLWQNAHTIVIGRNQDAWRECRVDAFERDGGSLVRRLSGGGAVYHDLGNLNFTFLVRARDYDVEKQTEVIRLAARAFGIDAARSGRNDILADGRKFSGNAFYRAGDQCYHHGTILIDTDMEVLGRYLNPSPEKLAGKGIASVRSRVVNLRELSPGITDAGMRGALIEEFSKVYGGVPEEIMRESLASPELDALTEKYASVAWRLGEPKPYTARFAKRLSFGEVDVRLAVREGMIERAQIYTDAMDADWAPQVADALTGTPYFPEHIAAALAPSTAAHPNETAEFASFLAKSTL